MAEGNPAKIVLAMRATCYIFWGALFIGQQYMSIYLKYFPFTNDFLVGILMAAGYLITTVSQLIWGYVADHARTKNRVLTITLSGLSIGFLLLILPKISTLPVLMIFVFFVYIFLKIPQLLIDTIVVENTDRLGISFGSVKCFSSAGAGTASFLMFILSLWTTPTHVTAFIFAFIITALSLIPAQFLPPTKGHAYKLIVNKDNRDNTSLRAILKNPRMVLLLTYLLLMFIFVSATNLFMGIYYSSEEGLNAGLGMYGLFFAICIGLETAIMVLGKHLLQKMKIHHIFTLCCFATCSRSLILYLAQNVYVAQLCAIGHALLCAPLWTRLSPYVNDIVSKELRATGQAAWSMMVFGLGPMIGSAIGGAIAGAFSIRTVFLVSGVVLFVVAVVFYFLFKRQSKQAADAEPPCIMTQS